MVDLCSGKGFLSLLLAHEFPSARVLMIDSNSAIRAGFVEAFPSLSFLRADITSPAFKEQLRDELEAAVGAHALASTDAYAGDTAHARGGAHARDGASAPLCVCVGVHLCGQLASTAVSLFGSLERIASLVLVPCCLDKRADHRLKEAARIANLDPHHMVREEHICNWRALRHVVSAEGLVGRLPMVVLTLLVHCKITHRTATELN